jgi:HEPN domain-containing protein
MPDADPVHDLTAAWLAHAAADIRAAETLLGDAEELAPSIAFHAQQAIERCHKAVLVAAQIDFGRTHHLMNLSARIPADWDLDLPTDRFARITQYAAETRYPIDDWNQVEPVGAGEARAAVGLASAVHGQVTERLIARGFIESE